MYLTLALPLYERTLVEYLKKKFHTHNCALVKEHTNQDSRRLQCLRHDCKFCKGDCLYKIG